MFSGLSYELNRSLIQVNNSKESGIRTSDIHILPVVVSFTCPDSGRYKKVNTINDVVQNNTEQCGSQ